MDVTVTTRPQQSEPMQMPGTTRNVFVKKNHDQARYCKALSRQIMTKQDPSFSGGANPLQKPPVFIECGSANSFELSPRFANLAIRGSRVGERALDN